MTDCCLKLPQYMKWLTNWIECVGKLWNNWMVIGNITSQTIINHYINVTSLSQTKIVWSVTIKPQKKSEWKKLVSIHIHISITLSSIRQWWYKLFHLFSHFFSIFFFSFLQESAPVANFASSQAADIYFMRRKHRN